MSNEHLTQLTEILARYDLEGLLKLGAPRDEYAHEAEMLLERDAECVSVADTERILLEIWDKQFGDGVLLESGDVKPAESHEHSKFRECADEVFTYLLRKDRK